MVQRGKKRQGNYAPAQYRYDASGKHPQEEVVCELCGTKAWVKKGSRFCSKSCAQKGKNNSTWKGDEAGYVSMHARVYRLRGKAFGCTVCGANDPAKWYEWANLTGHYEDVDDYASMCRRCHKKFDMEKRPDKGRRVYNEELLDRAEEMRKTMSLKAVAKELGVGYTNLCSRLRERRT